MSEPYLMPCKAKYRSFKGRAVIKRHGQASSNNTKKKVNMFHRGIPRIPGVTEYGGKKE